MPDETERDAMHADRASKGGKARMRRLTKAQKSALARKAGIARWDRRKAGTPTGGETEDGGLALVGGKVSGIGALPLARWPGALSIGGVDVPCYVLEDGRRVITRTAATAVLTDGKGGGNLESYLVVEALKGYVPEGFRDQMIEFYVPGVSSSNNQTRGISAETFVDICQAYVAAFEGGALQTDRQKAIAIKAAMFLAACAKVGFIAMIDEATGYQYERPIDALQFKLKIFLAEEMRKWEKTFPDQLWEQFGRLTGWKGSLHSRPKYWGQLVMQLIYEYLDPDVAQWLRENAPTPMHGQNYHQWLSEQYGLKKLVEHIWKVVGIASTCYDINELKRKMEELYGHKPGFQLEFRLVGPRPDM